MDDIEFKPYDNEPLKRIGTGTTDDVQEEKKPSQKKGFNPSILIFFVIALAIFCTYLYYQRTVRFPDQTKNELLDIKSALYLYKESFGIYPTQLTELTKGRPLREIWLTDAWDNAYRYKVDDSKQTFTITSAGRDATFGTNDDIQVKH